MLFYCFSPRDRHEILINSLAPVTINQRGAANAIAEIVNCVNKPGLTERGLVSSCLGFSISSNRAENFSAYLPALLFRAMGSTGVGNGNRDIATASRDGTYR